MTLGGPTLAESDIPFIPPSERAPRLDELLEDFDERLGSKLDRIIALLERMVEPEEPPLACPRCGDSENLEQFDGEDGSKRVICIACDYRFTLSAELVG